METAFENKCGILSELWLNYRNDSSFRDFFVYNDLALPLAFMVDEGIVDNINDMAKSYIDEAFDLLLQAAGLQDLSFESLDDILGNIQK